jgi:anti-sigma B factor antagonist
MVPAPTPSVGGGRWSVSVQDVLRVESTLRAGRPVVHVTGDLDLAGAPSFRQAMVAALGAPGVAEPPQVTLDLTACDHLDSVGLGLVLGVLKRVRGRQGSLTVVCPAGPARRVLDLVALHRLVPVLDALADTVRAEEPA